jgi:hypothetical protein
MCCICSDIRCSFPASTSHVWVAISLWTGLRTKILTPSCWSCSKVRGPCPSLRAWTLLCSTSSNFSFRWHCSQCSIFWTFLYCVFVLARTGMYWKQSTLLAGHWHADGVSTKISSVARLWWACNRNGNKIATYIDWRKLISVGNAHNSIWVIVWQVSTRNGCQKCWVITKIPKN